MKRKHAVPGIIPPDPDGRVHGRPTIFSDDLAAMVCDLIATGESLNKICQIDGYPGQRTIFNWLNKEGDQFDRFRHTYARAREAQAERQAEMMIDIADECYEAIISAPDMKENGVAQAYKLRIDTRKWVAAKLLPRKYGDRVEQVHSGQINTVTLPPESLAGQSAPPESPKKPDWASD